MQCLKPNCSGQYQEAEVTYKARWQNEVIEIDHVPAQVCSECQDVVISSATEQTLDKIIRQATGQDKNSLVTGYSLPD